MSEPVKRYCGNCKHHDAERLICLENLSYAAWVYKYSEAGDCPGYDEGNQPAPAQAPGGPVNNYWGILWGLGAKP